MEKMRTIPELERKLEGANHAADFALKTAILLFGTSVVVNLLDHLNSGWESSEFNTTGIAGGLTAGGIHAYYKVKERRLVGQIKELRHIEEQGVIIDGSAIEVSDYPRLKE